METIHSITEINNLLPKNWSEVSLKQYQKVLNDVFNEEMENKTNEEEGILFATEINIKLIAALTGINEEKISELTLSEINSLASKLSFIKDFPKAEKTSVIAWKNIEEITYNDYVTYVTYAKDGDKVVWQNMPIIMRAFSKTDLSNEEALSLSMDKVFTAFFLLQKKLRKSIHSMLVLCSLKVIKMKTKKLLSRFNRKKQTTTE